MLKAAVIGVGSMGRNHARVYHELENTVLVSVADTNLDLAVEVAASYGIRGYGDFKEMLEVERPDAVSIVVPTSSHEDVTMHILESGAHVLVEKPIAATIEQAQRIVTRARQLDLKLMVGQIMRFNPAIQSLKHRLDSGELGRIFQITCRRIGPFPERIRDVGVVVDLAPHDLDIMRYLTGLDPIRVYAETEQRIHTDHEDLFLGLLRFPGGITGSLEINWLSPSKIREVQVLGEAGMFRVDDLTQDLYFYESAQPNSHLWPALENLKGASEGTMTRYTLKRIEPLKAEIQAFSDAVLHNHPVPVSGEDGLEALRLALMMVRSSRINQVIELNHAAF